MKTIACASILILALISLGTPWATSAQFSGPSASGIYRFVMEDELTRQVDFNVTADERGTATGQMTYRDESKVLDREPDDEEKPGEEGVEFFMTADLTTLTIDRNRALTSGVIRDSSVRSYVGRCVLLVVEDNGVDPDKLTWRFCKQEEGGWVPVDAEDERDQGASMQWWATDAERHDDAGVQSTNINPGIRQGCPTFSLAAYRFPDLRGEGQIEVLP
jgi:hypothetical protein